MYVIIKGEEGDRMLKIYTSPSCSSCRKVKEFLKDQNIDYVEKNILSSVLNERELKEILSKSENGTDDIISKRSKIIKEQNVDVDNMTVPQLIGFIRENPSVLKRPIIVNDRLIQVGYNEEEIRVFIPRELRNLISETCGINCPNNHICNHAYNRE
jgi:regulatory protein spx